MKILVAIVSCHSREELSNVIRRTWLFPIPQGVDVKFFRGRGSKTEPLEDEVFLECGDAYEDLPEKIQAIFSWAYDHGYDYCVKCDDDVILKLREWSENFIEKDFRGWQDPACKEGEIKTPWGFLYTVSKKAMRLVMDAKLPGTEGSLWNHWHANDEAFVSSVLHYNGIFLTHDPRHYIWQGDKTLSRGLPRRPLRGAVTIKTVTIDPSIYATVIYLKWNVKNADMETIVKEFYKVWEIMKTQEEQCVGL